VVVRDADVEREAFDVREALLRDAVRARVLLRDVLEVRAGLLRAVVPLLRVVVPLLRVVLVLLVLSAMSGRQPLSVFSALSVRSPGQYPSNTCL
jgi:hypothetical protein